MARNTSTAEFPNSIFSERQAAVVENVDLGLDCPCLHLALEYSSCVSLDLLNDLSVPQAENVDMMLLSTWDGYENYLRQKT